MAATKTRTPEQLRSRRIAHLVMMGLKLVLLGMVFLIALDGPGKAFAVAIGAVLESLAVVCFVKAYLATRPPRPPESYQALQDAMTRLRQSEVRAASDLPGRSPLDPH